MKLLAIPCVISLAITNTLSHAQTSELVIVESNAAAYSAGELFPADTTFRLDRGQRLVIATSNGMIELEGPHAAPAQGDPPSAASALRSLRQLIGTATSELSGLGGSRSAGGDSISATPDSRPSPWYINAEITGEQCYVEGRPTEIWRSNTGQASRYEIQEVSTDRIGTVNWSATENAASWPASLPPQSGQVYLVRAVGELVSETTIRVFSLEPGAAADPYSAAAWLAARGCTGQARIALAALD